MGLEIHSQRFAHPAGPNGSLEVGGLGEIRRALPGDAILPRAFAWFLHGEGSYMDDVFLPQIWR